MILHNGDREFGHWACEDVPPDADVPALRDPSGQFHDGEWWAGSGRSWDRVLIDLDVTQAQVDDGSVRVARVLITTPEGPQDSGALFPPGTWPAPLRFGDSPEILTRGDGWITVL